MKKNKIKIVLSSAVILLPILFGLIMWDKLPDSVATHWGFDGAADGFGTKPLAVFCLPILLLLLHLVCLFFTMRDNSGRGQSKKALDIIFWLVPLTSLFSNGLVYAAAFGRTFDFSILLPLSLGITFIFVGNYLPKVKQNMTLGIKVSWTLSNEENWNRTHRLAGKVWVICGIVSLFSIFLPGEALIPVSLCIAVAAAGIPIVYSYCIYKKHQKEGVEYGAMPGGKSGKMAGIISAFVVVIILVSVTVLMFTGDIEVSCGDSAFKIETAYWPDMEVDYSKIESIAYRDDLDVGTRTNGFGSARLLMGTFRNDEFGSYTLYAYAAAKEHIVLEIGGKTLVIGMGDTGETRELYKLLQAKIEK